MVYNMHSRIAREFHARETECVCGWGTGRHTTPIGENAKKGQKQQVAAAAATSTTTTHSMQDIFVCTSLSSCENAATHFSST